MFDNTFYSKLNQALYDMPYVNYGSKNADQTKKYIKITKTLSDKYAAVKLERLKKLDDRIDKLLVKYKSRQFNFIEKYLTIGYNRTNNKQSIIKFIKSDKRFSHLDVDLIESFMHKGYQSRKDIKKRCNIDYGKLDRKLFEDYIK